MRIQEFIEEEFCSLGCNFVCFYSFQLLWYRVKECNRHVTCFLTCVFQRPHPSTAEAKVPTPKFDLLASNFPPLPGSSSRTPGELVLESRMSDVVKGVCKEKVNTETSIYILWDQFLPLFSVLLLELEFYLHSVLTSARVFNS